MISKVLTSTLAAACLASSAWAQAAPAPATQPAQPQAPRCSAQGAVRLPDGRVAFSLCATQADSVGVTSSDYNGIRSGATGMVMTRDSLGRWSGTTAAPVPPGTYRYNFRVNGIEVTDPLATRYSEERTGTNGLLEIPGPAGHVQDYNPAIAHGVVSEIEYMSESLGVKRRAHVYTPPGYMKNSISYPVLYLVHGAGDSDNSWTTVGRANYVFDNLIAAGTAQPMIVVMPFGHTPDRPGATGGTLNNPDFGNDLIRDLIPFVEANYRTLNTPATRAMAGLSMGGAHTIRNGLTHPELFGYIGIFSMGLSAGDEVAAYETQNETALRRGAREFKLVYYAIGKDDFLYNRVAPTRAMLDKFQIQHTYNETAGGHTWINWRDYLVDFTPKLFK